MVNGEKSGLSSLSWSKKVEYVKRQATLHTDTCVRGQLGTYALTCISIHTNTQIHTNMHRYTFKHTHSKHTHTHTSKEGTSRHSEKTVWDNSSLILAPKSSLKNLLLGGLTRHSNWLQHWNQHWLSDVMIERWEFQRVWWMVNGKWSGLSCLSWSRKVEYIMSRYTFTHAWTCIYPHSHTKNLHMYTETFIICMYIYLQYSGNIWWALIFLRITQQNIGNLGDERMYIAR